MVAITTTKTKTNNIKDYKHNNNNNTFVERHSAVASEALVELVS